MSGRVTAPFVVHGGTRGSGAGGGCTRGNGVRAVVRTMVPTRGMGPGLPLPWFYRVFWENDEKVQIS